MFSSFSALVEGGALLAYRLLTRLAEGCVWDDDHQSKLPSLDWNVISGIPYTGSVSLTSVSHSSVSSLYLLFDFSLLFIIIQKYNLESEVVK